jgi:hypothetical protein
MRKEVGDWNTVLFPNDEELKEICRLGKGSECCPFLVCGSDGFECWKMNYPSNTILHNRVDAGTMNAKGKPCDWDKTAALA